MIIIKNKKEMEKYFKKEINTYVFEDTVVFMSDMAIVEIDANIEAVGIEAVYLIAKNIKSVCIKASKIKASLIVANKIASYNVEANELMVGFGLDYKIY